VALEVRRLEDLRQIINKISTIPGVSEVARGV